LFAENDDLRPPRHGALFLPLARLPVSRLLLTLGGLDVLPRLAFRPGNFSVTFSCDRPGFNR